MMKFPAFTWQLPTWIQEQFPDAERVYSTVEERMQVAIQLARHNIEQGTGGPFGAAVFDLDTHKLIAPGVNLVVPTNCAIAHAEIVAITMAQQVLGSFDLGAEGLPRCELVTSTEPCAMCFGAVPWSGVRQLVCGARDEDARAVGFDEGPKLQDWQAALESRGIRVIRDIGRAEGAAVLRHYMEQAGVIYNGRRG